MSGRPRVLPAGPTGRLVEVGSTDEAVALYAAARAAGLSATDIVPAARTVLFDGVDPEQLRSFLAASPTATRTPVMVGDEVVEVPTRYDGADLDDVARRWGMTRAEAVATHTGHLFVVAFSGFAPGFPYCTGLPPELAVPRLDTPRTQVPAGSVAVAGEFTGVYPTASPGGWRLLGRTSLPLWVETRPEPATLPPGTRVQFVAVDR